MKSTLIALACLLAPTLVFGSSGGLSLPLTHKPRHKFSVVEETEGSFKRTWSPRAFRGTHNPLVDFEGGPGSRVPLNGNIAGVGEFYVTFYSPLPNGKPQEFQVQVDTGSSDLGVIGNKCKNCGSPASKFDPASSRTVSCKDSQLQCFSCTSEGQCQYTLSYLDGSGYTADVYQAPIYFEGSSSLRGGSVQLKGNATLGAIVSETKGFESPPVEGIMGFAYPGVSQIGAKTAFQSLVDAGSVSDIFSLAISANEGQLYLGGTGLPDGTPIQYTPITSPNSFYLVYVADMLVNGQSLGVDPSVYNQGGAIVDSGTTQFLIPQKAYNSLASITKGMCSSTSLVGVCDQPKDKSIFDGYCFQMSESDRLAYPTLSVKIGQGNDQLKLDLGPQYYLTPYSETNQNLWCMGAVGVPISDGTIMGDVFMQAYTVVFDRENSRVGFHANSA